MNCVYIIYCTAGLSLVFSYDDLSYQKFANQSHTFPGTPLMNASLAVDRLLNTCTRTEDIGINSPRKTVLWTVDLGGVFNIYRINIIFKNYDGYELRQRGRFAGFSLFVSKNGVKGESFLCYKDGPQLPPLHFTTTCAKYGRYVIFYNERLTENYPAGYELHNGFAELCEVVVLGCNKSGVYGSNCNIPCPINCKDNMCHIQNGTCFVCISGWTGLFCNTTCTEGWYGINCGQQCAGHCRGGASCNHVTGQCDGGCAAGWTGMMCDEKCVDGTHGYNCVHNCSGHCLNDSACNKQTGQCDKGCSPGYTNDDCRKQCKAGYFGMECKNHCSGHCIDKQPCHHVSGRCLTGCQDGYMESHCNKTCQNGHYGTNCSLVCSSKCETCRHTDGLCTCEEGWMGLNCSTECSQSYGKDCKHQCDAHCMNNTCNRFNGSCLSDISKYINTPSQLSDILPVTVGGIVGTCLFVIVGAVMAMFFMRLKRKSRLIAKRQSIILEERHPTRTSTTEPSIVPNCKTHNFHSNVALDATYALPEKTKRGPPTNKNIFVRNMKAQITNMSANDSTGFKSEYHDIPRGELHQCKEGKKPENKVKNRYTTVFPYDHSRVILRTTPTNEDGYINANFIDDAQGRRTYIATQGPKPKTITDFWTMIWQEEVCTIVCLTNLTEGTKNKCAQYWPDVNDKLQGGTLTIRHLHEKKYAEYIIRLFKLHNKSIRTDRNVTMFHYTTWSDHGVADPLSLVVFHRHVIRATANSAGKFTVVHCSAGVGRTGTYIALDALYREGERTGKINVPMYVRTMRKDRMNMIQGDDQYKLLYLALKDAFYGQKKCLKTEKFLGDYQEQTCYANHGDITQMNSFSSDLEELLSLRKEYTQQDYLSGRAQISANYTESVLPVEEFMCHLYYIKGYNTYYNAVLIQSYLEKDSLISAQYPLPDNTEDFLRLVKDFDARVVVFLCPLGDIESTSKWFPSDNQHKFNGIFCLKKLCSSTNQNVKTTRLNIQPTGFNEMEITLLECPTWGERQKKGDKRVLLDVIKAVKTEKSDHKGRVLVLSRDGATRCGPFFVVYNVLEQISVDREVDIFTAVRQIQIRRPECVSTVDEYKLCHDAVAEYLLNDCVYGNC